MLVKSDAIIIKSFKYGDTSKIITAFSREYGKISLLAKGALQHKSKFAGCIEALNEINASFYYKNNTDLYLLSSADIINSMQNVYKNLEHYSSGLLIMESISILKEKHIPNDLIYDQTSQILKIIKTMPPNPFAYFVKMQLLLAESTGYDITTEDSAIEQEFVLFNMENNQIIHTGNYQSRSIYKLQSTIYNKLSQINSTDDESISTISFSHQEKLQAIEFIESYFSFHLDRNVHFKAAFLL